MSTNQPPKAAKTKGCKCIASVNKALAERGARLVGAIMLRGGTPKAHVEIESTEYTPSGRQKPIRWHLSASFCPFCGKGYRS